MAQTYATHAHHPIPTYIASVFALIAMVASIGAWLFGWLTIPVSVVSLSFAVAVLVAISRTYITTLQDRIIMLEMKIRCAELLPAGKSALLSKLSAKQVAALRFASDDELEALLERSISDNLPPRVIKQSIKNWRPDYHRT
jgi:Family of unknown function (DUF6526)